MPANNQGLCVHPLRERPPPPVLPDQAPCYERGCTRFDSSQGDHHQHASVLREQARASEARRSGFESRQGLQIVFWVWLNLVERRLREPETGGSNPPTQTITPVLKEQARDYESRRSRFDSWRGYRREGQAQTRLITLLP